MVSMVNLCTALHMASWTYSSSCSQNQLCSHLSATITPYVKPIIDLKLSICPNHIKFSSTLNWPNVSSTSLDIVHSLSNFRNLDFLIPTIVSPTTTFEWMIIFDIQNMARNGSHHINFRLSKERQEPGVARHSRMSSKYLHRHMIILWHPQVPFSSVILQKVLPRCI
jgi:hypothetical protein